MNDFYDLFLHLFIQGETDRWVGRGGKREEGGEWIGICRQVCACYGTGKEQLVGWPSPSTLWVMGIKIRQLDFPYVMFDVWAAPVDR